MRFTASLVAAIVAAGSQLVQAGLEDVKTGKHLTVKNFDSSIAGKNALVAFYAPWCGHCKSLEPTWEKLAQDFKDDEETVLIGQLDADNADNRPVASRYGVKGYPTIKFFPADGSAPKDYQSPRTQDAFIEYINNEAGTHRTAGGLLNELAGRVPSLDTLAATFLASSTDARDSIIAQAKELAASLTGSTSAAEKSGASYYLKVMEKVSQSNDWAANEVARLQKMASKRGTMAGKQLDDLQIRQNILAAFTAAKASASSILSDASATIAGGPSAVSASASSLASAAAASVDFGTAAAAAGASKVSASAGSVYNEAVDAAGKAYATASASVDSAASAASGSAQSVINNVYAAASGASAQGSASVSSGSVAASSAASSASKSAASAASQASKSGRSAASEASKTASSASKQGTAAASGVSASVKSAASQASASVDSAVSNASQSASSVYSAASGAASSAGKRIADEL